MSYHFIGIGGVGMSALAHILLQKGLKVTGSDSKASSVTAELEKRGARIFYQQKRGNVQKGQTIIYSTAIPATNEEWIDANEKGCKLLHRSELLEELMQEKKAVVIAGSHGKTTTTTLLSYVLDVCKLEPSYVIGGFSPSLPANGKWGKGEYFIAEGDESDGSFLRTQPYGAILTNIDFDHLAYWKTKEALLDAFRKFIQSVEDPNLFFYCADDPFLTSWKVKGVGYGVSSNAALRATAPRFEQGKSHFDIHFQGRIYKNVTLNLMGAHNILNSLPVFGMSLLLGGKEELIRQGLLHFRGVKRRLERKGERSGAIIYDDYAHHPKEIEETLKALKKAYNGRRIVAVFQPHRYTRMQELMKEFADVLSGTSDLFITDIYSAGEKTIEGITTSALLAKLQGKKDMEYVPREHLTKRLKESIREGDVVVTLGAGDVTQVSDEILKD